MVALYLFTSAAVLIVLFILPQLRTYASCVWLNLRLPGPPALPLIGHAHFLFDRDRLDQLTRSAFHTYGSIVGGWMAVLPLVFVFNPRHIQQILGSSKHVGKVLFYKMTRNFLGDGLTVSDVPIWKINRKLMQPMFNLRNLETFIDSFNKAGNLVVDKVQNQISAGGEIVKISPIINQSVFALLFETVLGIPMGSAESLKAQEESPFRSGSISVFQRLAKPWLLLPFVFNATNLAGKESNQKNARDDFTKKIMKERRQMYAEGVSIAQKCFLDHLLQIVVENPGVFTDDNCAREACTLMLAGQDSVATALSFTIHLLANHPKVQEKALVEQIEIFGKTTNPVSLHDLRKMGYLEMCVKEAMRLYPSVPMIFRKLGEGIQLDKWYLPKGCTVCISPYVTHRLEEYFPKPESFIPERFEDETNSERSHFSYLPFSAGSRNCIGYKYAELEMMTILSILLRHFELSAVQGKEEIKLNYRVALRAVGGVWVTFTPRNYTQSC